ncbi:MAG: SLBB domain-containing protein [Gemmatimonadetes bacterium]|nr:SLBB domain-containing protein [Gemmatimonadota bacterium]
MRMERWRRAAGLVVGFFVWAAEAWYSQEPRDSVGAAVRRAALQDSLRRVVEGRGGPSGVTHVEIIEGLRQSGLSREQVRGRLAALGYDSGLLDAYFDVLERGGEAPRGGVGGELERLLRRLGVVVREGLGEDTTFFGVVDSLVADSLAADTVDRKVFGRMLFRRATTQFQPLVLGPVDAGYRVGPGDEVVVVVSGEVEAQQSVVVGREGTVVLPAVGSVFVSGQTLEGLGGVLRERLGRVYSAVREGRARVEVGLGRLRLNQVYVVGEVVRPSAYVVGGGATVLTALYQAGGPTKEGSFRGVVVRRGGKVVGEVDLYDYLLTGASGGDVRLEHGDVVFVPVVGRRVEVVGAVRRAGIYELRGGEGLEELLRYAGGVKAEAVVERVQVDRILAPGERRPGLWRVVLDGRIGEGMELRDGDVVRVFGVGEGRRRRVVVTGEVRRPGEYEWEEGSTLWGLLERAGGLGEGAYRARAHVYRWEVGGVERRLLRTALVESEDVGLWDQDSVVVFSRERLRQVGLVTVSGFVKDPGAYEWVEGMTVKDVILAAGGFAEGAYTAVAEVARRPELEERTDTTARVYRVELEREYVGAGVESVEKGRGGGKDGVPEWRPSVGEFVLERGDRVFVRKAPGYERPRVVTVSGEVALAGSYVLGTRGERVADLLRRAGGLTREAYAPGFRLVRDSQLVAVDLERALGEEASRHNVLLEAGDSLHVPRYDGTVVVKGKVQFESRVFYTPGKGLDYYVERSGGYAEGADKGRVAVTYASGERAVVKKLLFARRGPAIEPGSTVFVPEKPAAERRGFELDQFLTRTLSIVSTTAALLIAFDQINK